jgi:hypothetical protein
MSDGSNFGFAKLVPGFDFLQNLTRGATQSMPQMPSLASWIAPTLNVEELEKRIADLKAVQFWLDQNGKALGATIQALEVQKMTLATLEGMNVSMGELANALKLKTADALAGGAPKASATAGAGAGKAAGAPASAPAPAREQASAASAEPSAPRPAGNGGAAAVDPLQWWGALTHQFQQIAADAMKDVAQKTAADTARNMATGKARDAAKAASRAAAKAPAASTKGSKTTAAPVPAAEPAMKPARKAPARKSRSKTVSS